MKKLQPTLSLFDAVNIALGAIIGAGIFVILGAAAKVSGPAVFISIIVAAVVAGLTGIAIDATGLPANWLVFSSKVSSVPVNGTVTNSITIAIPANEPSGTRTLTITVTTAEGKTVSRSIALGITGIPANGTIVTPPVTPPSGLTGAILAITSNPQAAGLIVAAVIVGGAFLASKRLPRKSEKTEKKEVAKETADKTERKYI